MSHSTYLDYISQFFSDTQEFEDFTNSLKIPLPRSFTLAQSRHQADSTLAQLQAQGFDSVQSDYNSNNHRLIQKEVQYGENSNNEEVTQNSEFRIQNLPLGKTPEHILGYLYIQETAASLPASIAEIPMSGNILDMCAAPGGKTTQLADRAKLAGSQALIRANEPDGKRLVSLGSNITRSGLENVVLTQYNGEQFGTSMPEFFDTILLDTPCSGEGTGFKSDFGTKFWDIRKVESIARVQQQLLVSAVKSCKIGGQIVYSTCTINPIENEVNAAWLLEKYSDILELEKIEISGLSEGLPGSIHGTENGELIIKNCRRLRPHIHHTGGFFLCVLRKKGAVPLNPITIEKHNKSAQQQNNFSKFTPVDQGQVKNRLSQEFGIQVPAHIVFVGSKNQIYATHNQIIPYLHMIKFDRPGLPVIKGDKPHSRRVTHGAGLIFDFDPKFQYNLDDKQISQHIAMEDIDIPKSSSQAHNGYIQLLRHGTKVGVGKIVDGVIKNKLTGVL